MTICRWQHYVFTNFFNYDIPDHLPFSSVHRYGISTIDCYDDIKSLETFWHFTEVALLPIKIGWMLVTLHFLWIQNLTKKIRLNDIIIVIIKFSAFSSISIRTAELTFISSLIPKCLWTEDLINFYQDYPFKKMFIKLLLVTFLLSNFS